MNPTRQPRQVLDDLVEATNAHDLERLVRCFASDYVLTDPAHPARSFTGSAQVERNWRSLFTGIPDLRLEVQNQATTDSGFWLEAAQVGTRRDGTPMRGQMVFIAEVAAGCVMRARVYVVPVEPGGPSVDAVIAAMSGAGGRP